VLVRYSLPGDCTNRPEIGRLVFPVTFNCVMEWSQLPQLSLGEWLACICGVNALFTSIPKFLLILEGSVPHLTRYLVGRVSLAWQSIHFTMFKRQFIKTVFVTSVSRRPLLSAEFYDRADLSIMLLFQSPDRYFREFLNV